MSWGIFYHFYVPIMCFARYWLISETLNFRGASNARVQWTCFICTVYSISNGPDAQFVSAERPPAEERRACHHKSVGPDEDEAEEGGEVGRDGELEPSGHHVVALVGEDGDGADGQHT